MKTGPGKSLPNQGSVEALQTRIAYLERSLRRTTAQQERQEHIDDINRRLIRHVSAELAEALQLAEQSNRAKTEFLATMSHEIRSPLNIILGMGELLVDTELDTVQHTYLENLLSAGRQLLEQLTNILEFSRLESGTIHVKHEAFRFDLLISSLQAMMTTLAQNKRLTFTMIAPEQPLGIRFGDLPKIKQILFNVLNNALKFTDQGGIEMAIHHDSEHPTHNMMQFTISDTGIGIPADRIEYIFDRFAQAESGLRARRGGTGLGLAICQKLVNALHGEITVSSEIGKGSTFIISLPLPVPPNHEPLPPYNRQQSDELPATAQLNSLRILVAEDVPANGAIIKHYLAPYQVEIDHVTDGAHAVQLFAENNYDIVLLDIKMPGLDGVATMYRLRDLMQVDESPDIPVIAVTAHAFPEQVVDYLQQGFSGVLIKPFSKADLVRTISHFHRFPANSPASHLRISDKPHNGMTDDIPDSLIPLIADVLNTLENDYEALNGYVKSADIQNLRDRCHAAKGLAGLYGLHSLAALFTDLENQADRQPIPDVSDLAPLRIRLAQVRKNLACRASDRADE